MIAFGAVICLTTNPSSVQAAELVYSRGQYFLMSNDCAELTWIAGELNLTTAGPCRDMSDDPRGRFVIKANELPENVKTPLQNPTPDMNCWGTSLRYWGITDSSRYASNQELEIALNTGFIMPISKEEVQPGDMAVLRQGRIIIHSLVILTPTLAFDKAGYSTSDAFRVARKSELLAKDYDVNKTKNRTISYYRLREPRQAALARLSPAVLASRSEFLSAASALRSRALQIKRKDGKGAQRLADLVDDKITTITKSEIEDDERVLLKAEFLDIHDIIARQLLEDVLPPLTVYSWRSLAKSQRSCVDLLKKALQFFPSKNL